MGGLPGEASNVELVYDTLYFDIFIWALFAIETLTLCLLVSHPSRYLRENWLNLIIVLMGFTILMGWELQLAALRILRLLIVFALLAHVGSRVKKMLSRNQLGPTLIASAIIIIMSGVMIAALEPGIDSPFDGIWWAWVTVTTVGYGDFVPVTLQGRLFASLVMLMGLGIFAMITASLAAYFMSQKEEEVLSEERDQFRKLCDVEERLYAMEQKMEAILKKLSEK